MSKKFVHRRKNFVGKRPTASQEVRRPTEGQRSISYTIAEALEIFIRAKEAEGVRERTIKDYRSHIRYLCDFVGKVFDTDTPEKAKISAIDADLIRRYINYLRTEKNAYSGVTGRETEGRRISVSTINIRLRTLRTMCRFWAEEGILPDNPMKNIRPLREDEVEEVPGISDDDLSRILAHCDETTFAGFRDRVIILLMIDTGLRPYEATSLTIDRIDEKAGIIIVPSEIAKNRKWREVPISREVVRELLQLYEESQQYFGDTDGRIFMNAYGDPFTDDSFRKRLSRIRKKLGIDRLHPNQFRHTFARKYLLNGGDLFSLQRILDHANIQTTRKYVQMDTSDLIMQHNRYSPAKKYVKKRNY